MKLNHGEHHRYQRNNTVVRMIGAQQERKLQARRKKNHGLWFGLGMFGLVGWSVAVPMLICIAIGVWLDKQYNDGISWTLTFLFVGLILGCLNAWYWIKKESTHE